MSALPRYTDLFAVFLWKDVCDPVIKESGEHPGLVWETNTQHKTKNKLEQENPQTKTVHDAFTDISCWLRVEPRVTLRKHSSGEDVIRGHVSPKHMEKFWVSGFPLGESQQSTGTVRPSEYPPQKPREHQRSGEATGTRRPSTGGGCARRGAERSAQGPEAEPPGRAREPPEQVCTQGSGAPRGQRRGPQAGTPGRVRGPPEQVCAQGSGALSG